MKEVMKEQGEAIQYLTGILKSLVESYRLLVASAAEMNNIYEARSSQVKVIIKRSEAVGLMIDNTAKILGECSGPYFEYCKIKGKVVYAHTSQDDIFTEVDNDLALQNSKVNYGSGSADSSNRPKKHEDKD